MTERHCCPPGVQVGRFTWRGQLTAAQRHTTETNGGFMILYQLSLAHSAPDSLLQEMAS